MSGGLVGPGQYTTATAAQAAIYVERPGELGGIPLAAWPRRTAATAIDIVLTILLPAQLPDRVGEVAVLVLVVFNSVFMQTRTCRSFGKVIMGLYLVWPSSRDNDMYGAYPSALRCAARIVAHVVDLFFFLGFFRPLWDRYRRTFADSIAKTVVTSKPLNFVRMPVGSRSAL